MIKTNIHSVSGRRYPAGRLTKNVVGGLSPITAHGFCMGYVELDAGGGQVPWHNHEQEEIYLLLEGTAEVCVGQEREILNGGEAVYIPSNEYHQLTNVGAAPARMIYCYAPAGDVLHWKQELEGTLPREGLGAPPLPAGALPQKNG